MKKYKGRRGKSGTVSTSGRENKREGKYEKSTERKAKIGERGKAVC